VKAFLKFFKSMRAREKVKRRKIFSLSKIGKTWRQKAYHSIPLSGLSAVSQTQLGTEQKNWWISEVAVRGRARDVLCMSQPSSAAYRLYIPARAKFISYIALMPNARRKYDQRIAFQVEVIEDGDGIKITRQKFISPSRFNRDPKWIKFRLGLGRLANRQANIILSTYVPDGTALEHTPAIWGDPTVSFRISLANLITVGKKALRAHGVLALVKKIASRTSPIIRHQATTKKLSASTRQFQSESLSPDSSVTTTVVDQYLTEVFARSAGPSPEYVSICKEGCEIDESDIKLIAFYLPQFHPIPENDEWWGRGFTEWTHVSRATPQFVGHYQPRLPGELGFYDLRIPEIQERQIRLARKYGLFGFCFHYYWFGGKRLLDLPLKQFLNNPQLDFRFCLCWANEHWTRRWDGLDHEVLIAQAHSPEDDLAFIQSLEPAFRDRRYIRVNGRPLLVIYKPSLLPDPKASAQRWRDYCARNSLGGLYLVAVQASETEDPRPLGFDATVEFPPHELAVGAPVLNGQMKIVNPNYQGVICDYSYLIESAKKISRADFTLFRGVCPSWDNEARKPGRGMTYQNSTPTLYQEWLAQACRFAAKESDPDKRLVFINAWNEWSEGAYLEPDRRYGYAYLQATSNALKEFTKSDNPGLEIVFVSHDAANAGAQRLLITLIEWLRDKKGIRPKIILRHGGPLVPNFYQLGPVLELDSLFSFNGERIRQKLLRFCGNSNSLVYINTLVSGDIATHLSKLQIPVITHAHELENALKRWCSKEELEHLIGLTDHFIAASPPVARNLEIVHRVSRERITTVYEFIKCREENRNPLTRIAIRRQKQLPEEGFNIFGCGTTDWRKGPDLFIEVADQANRLGMKDAYFFWIGTDTGELEQLQTKVRKLGLQDRVVFLGEVQDARSYFAAGDLFLLTSREDPFPLVCLEAADCGLPIVCFDKVGGMPDFVQNDAGYVIPFEDTRGMAEKVVFLCAHQEELIQRGATAQQRVRADHDVAIGGEEIFSVIDQFAQRGSEQISSPGRTISSVGGLSAPKVSVIVPNYNHAPYLRQRLDSIINQTFRDLEVVVLDDASTDNSREIIQTYAHYPMFRFLFNETGNRSAFKQWQIGLENARGEYVWFAESDDCASPHFLSKLLPILESDKSLGLVYCQSYLIDPSSRVVGDAVQWTDDLDPWRWKKNFINNGRVEIKDYLSKKNIIPNASAVLLRASVLRSIDGLDAGYTLCGDWLLWIKILLRSNVGYVAEKLNYWRQRSSNARTQLPGVLELNEGSQIINYLAEELRVPAAEREELLANFATRCAEWMKA
jgi:glycosyltransferase involved in cell wall biosynthesis